MSHSLIHSAMTQEEKYAKILALSIIYEKAENHRMPFVERIVCRNGDLDEILDDVYDHDFKNWIRSVAPHFRG